MNLYSQLQSGKGCIDALNLFVTDLELMTDAIIEVAYFDPDNRALYEYSTFNFTNSLGRFSPILRNCYKIGGEIDKNWNSFWGEASSVRGIYRMIKANVIRNSTDIDDRGSSLYDAYTSKDYPQTSFDVFRLGYLYFLQTLTTKQTLLK
jgi:hypothetical protein